MIYRKKSNFQQLETPCLYTIFVPLSKKWGIADEAILLLERDS